MKHILQILLFFFTWFSSCAIAQLPKVGLRNYAVSFSTTENQNPENKLKIDICNFARSGISENSFSQKAILWESSVVDNRAREVLDHLNKNRQINKNAVQKFGGRFDIDVNVIDNCPNCGFFIELKNGEKIRLGVSGAGSLIDDALATALKTHPNRIRLGLELTEIDEFRVMLNSKMPNSASDIFAGLKSHLDAGTSFENMQQMISGLKNDWGNFSDGSKWVFNYTSSSQGLTKFGGKKITFELPTATELGLRRIDLADVTIPANPVLYEFKSVITAFNSTYATQFVKDLETATNLNQIKWIYDGAKNPVLNKTQILNLIENVNIPQTTINKYLPDLINPPKSKLIDLLDDEFNNIFKVINL